jgi:tRNA A-37 threonylcarbamoyl transferase component Bud32/TolB-like protein
VSIGSFDEFRSALAHRYQIEREVGHGGMATVYLARDLKLGRRVALKVLRTEVAQVLGEERFKREIELAAPLTHPNILPFIDSDKAAGRLFYVMPFIEGGTLADRIARGPRPTLTEALEITRQVAAGLSYAHSIGVVHRDIKPANILLATGHAWLSDFGIARMVRDAITDTGERLTDTGLAIGTVEYMPPEQLRGASKVDGRADEYSLACVLFEMLTGHLPSSSPGRPGALRQELRAAGVNLPTPIEAALERALALETDARFPTVAEFGAALEGAVEPRRVRFESARRAWGLWSALAGIGALAAVSAYIAMHEDKKGGINVVDTTRIALFPFDHQLDKDVALHEDERLADGFGRWRGLTIVDRRQMLDALAETRGRIVTSSRATEVARALRAGRFVRGTIVRVGDSLRVQATLYDVPTGGRPVWERVVKLALNQGDVESVFNRLVDDLLLRGNSLGKDVIGEGSWSLPATQEFIRGTDALRSWNLAAADSAYATATAYDPGFSEALLWLAAVRAWQDAPTAEWVYAADRAARGSSTLGGPDGVIAEALAAMARGDLGTACPAWRRATSRSPGDFRVWYGAGHCETHDSTVVPDAASPSKWKFRSSYWAALSAYRNAFRLQPATLNAFHGDDYESAKQLLFTTGTKRRIGRSAAYPEEVFVADPGWQGDSIATVPYPEAQKRPSPTRLEAVRHQREMFRDLMLSWTVAFPRSADARQGLAMALEMLGEPAALDTLHSARELAVDDAELVRVVGAEVWMRVRLSLPGRLAGLRTAATLADSLLARHAKSQHSPEPVTLAGLAVLTGRPTLAARLLRQAAASAHWDVPGALASAGAAFLAFGASGGPIDSLLAVESEVATAIERVIPPAGRLGMKMEWLGRAETLASPTVTFTSIRELDGHGDYLIDAFAALARGDTAQTRRILDNRVSQVRDRIDAVNRTFDTVYPEAWLFSALHEDQAACQWLDPALNVAGQMSPRGLELAVHAGSLVQAMALRAVLATRAGDRRTAQRWASSVVALWHDGEGSVQPVVRQMGRLLE